MATHILVERWIQGPPDSDDDCTYEVEYELGENYCVVRRDGTKLGSFRVNIKDHYTVDDAQGELNQVLDIVSLPTDQPAMGNMPLRGVKIARSLCADADETSEYVRGIAEFLCDFTDGLTQDDKESVIQYIMIQEME